MDRASSQDLRSDTPEPLDDRLLELELMHHWSAHTSKSLTSVWEYWQYQAPLIALKYRYALDALFALSALHLSREGAKEWLLLPDQSGSDNHAEAKIPSKAEAARRSTWKHDEVAKDEYSYGLRHRLGHPAGSLFNTAEAANQRVTMLITSRAYLDRALDGQREALTNLNAENVEAVFITSVMVSLNALSALGEPLSDVEVLSIPATWFRLSAGTRMICERWRTIAGPLWALSSGVFYGPPDLSDSETLFSHENAKTLEILLSWESAPRSVHIEDESLFQDALSYVCLMCKCIADGTDEPLATCRRILAMPSVLPTRFAELVEQGHPHALALLALVYASTKFIEDDVLWVQGIAERQVPLIQDHLSADVAHMVELAVDIARGSANKDRLASLLLSSGREDLSMAS